MSDKFLNETHENVIVSVLSELFLSPKAAFLVLK